MAEGTLLWRLPSASELAAAAEKERKEAVKLLKTVRGPLFAELHETDIARLALICPVEVFKAGDTVVDCHKTPSDCMHVILDGTFRVVVPTSDGPVEVQRLDKGDVFGYVCFVTRHKRQASMECCIDGRLVVIRTDDVNQVLELRSSTFWKHLGDTTDRIVTALEPARTNLIETEDDKRNNEAESLNEDLGKSFGRTAGRTAGMMQAAQQMTGMFTRVESWQSLDLTPSDVVLDTLHKYILSRYVVVAKTQVGSGYPIKMPCFEEFFYTMQKTNLNKDGRIAAYRRLKGLWYSRESLGYCPSFNPQVREGRVHIYGDRDIAEKMVEKRDTYDHQNTGSHWDGLLLEPSAIGIGSLIEHEGQTYVEIQIECCSSSGCDMCFGVCGGSHNIVNGQVAWNQADGMMYYCSSGYKYYAGKRFEFSAGRMYAKRAGIGDRVGLLVDSSATSRINPSGRSVSLYVNDEFQGVMFSEKQMQKLTKELGKPFEWPEPLYFAVDLKDSGQRVRILRERTFCSVERCVNRS